MISFSFYSIFYWQFFRAVCTIFLIGILNDNFFGVRACNPSDRPTPFAFRMFQWHLVWAYTVAEHRELLNHKTINKETRLATFHFLFQLLHLWIRLFGFFHYWIMKRVLLRLSIADYSLPHKYQIPQQRLNLSEYHCIVTWKVTITIIPN